MKVISDTVLRELSDSARASARLRKNLNLHPELSEPVQRFCNAFEPGTYVRPHRHPEENKWELFAILKGEAIILIFDDEGAVVERIVLSPQGPNYILEIPPNTWHTVLTIKPGTVLFEAKEGPYSMTSDKYFADWAPEENTSTTKQFVRWFEQAQTGSKPPVNTK